MSLSSRGDFFSNNDSLAPVVVFAHRRPLHLRRTLNTLESNSGARATSVTVICDGPRSANEQAACDAVAAEAGQIRKFGHLKVVQRDQNLGLSCSVIQGVTSMMQSNEKLIVLEDDMVLSPLFLSYMNESLRLYSDDDRVISVHGYAYPTHLARPFFLRGADCWGWATWRRGWNLFEPDGTALLQKLRDQSLTDAFDFDGTYPYTRMLEDQVAGMNDSWAIRWYASAFLAEKLTLYPGRSLVRNIGNDGSGTHGDRTDQFEGRLAQQAPDLSGLVVEESAEARAAFKQFFRELHRHHRAGSSNLLIIRMLRRLGRSMPRQVRK